VVSGWWVVVARVPNNTQKIASSEAEATKSTTL